MHASAGMIAVFVVAAAGPAHASPASGWDWGAVPVANYDADAGLGIGGIGALTRHAPGVAPYRASLQLQLFATSERVQGHELRWDVVGVGHPRLRLFGRAGYFATVNRNYCGTGGDVTCDPAAADAAADAAGLAAGTDARADFVRRYYRVRYVNPFVQTGARWRLDGRGRWSAFAQWRLYYYRPGTLGERGPYPGSRYALDHPDGEPGLASVPQLGVMYDTRDREGTPGCGVWIEASVHGASAVTGSAWRFAGGNVTARLYQRLGTRVVSATRLVADVATGDLPVAELGLVNAAETYVAFGGAAAGRGIRESRYVGRRAVIAQEEVRVDVSRRWVAIAFVDAAWIDDGGGDGGVRGASGLGARFVASQTFILRADLGVSPHEGWAPQLYLYLGHLF